MYVIKGNKTLNITSAELTELVKAFDSVKIDLGTGDGRFVYKNAVKIPNILFIGIDPSHTQLEEYSQRAVKNKIGNVLFVLGSVEQLPPELENLANSLYIILPWGTLLQSIVAPDAARLESISVLLKLGGNLEIVFGYDPACEPTEYTRLNLAEISEGYIKNAIVPAFKKAGLQNTMLRELDKNDLKNFETTWAKKLTFGKTRPMYLLHFRKVL